MLIHLIKFRKVVLMKMVIVIMKLLMAIQIFLYYLLPTRLLIFTFIIFCFLYKYLQFNNTEEILEKTIVDKCLEDIPYSNNFSPYFENFTTMLFFCWINKHNICNLHTLIYLYYATI